MKRFVIAFLSLVLWFSGFAYCLGKTEDPPSELLRREVSRDALIKISAILDRYASRTAGDPDFINVSPSMIFPITLPDGRENVMFEVKLSQKGRPDHGSVVVSLTDEFPSVLRFSCDGPSVVERLRQKAGHWRFKTVLLTPLYFTAEDEQGNLIDFVGIPPSYWPKDKPGLNQKISPDASGYLTFKRLFWERYLKYRLQRKQLMDGSSIRLRLNELKIPRHSKGDGSTSYVYPPDLPKGAFATLTADHVDRLPRYNQIPASTGRNDTNFPSGCVSCAWLCLIGYYDNTVSMDIMRGTHLDYGARGYFGYPARLMMALSRYIGTFFYENDGSIGGGVYHENIDRGYAFIREFLGHSITGEQYTETGGMQSLQLIYDKICSPGVPSVIDIPGHALNAYGVKINTSDLSEGHFVKVYSGGGGDAIDPYLPFEELDGAWSLDRIEPRCRYKLPRKSISAPALADIEESLLIAYRQEDEDIGLLMTSDGSSIMWEGEIEAKGSTAPSVAYDGNGKYFYASWTDTAAPAASLRLCRVSLTDHQIVDLPAPGESEIHPGSSPAICLKASPSMPRSLYLVWRRRASLETHIAWCPVDSLERQGRPWPSDNIEYQGAGHKILPLRIIGKPTLANYSADRFLVLGYQEDSTEGLTPASFASIVSDSGEIVQYFAFGYDPYRFKIGSNVCFFNGTLYSSTNGPIMEGDLVFEPWYDVNNIYLETKKKLTGIELYWPETTESLTASGETPSGHPNPSVLSAFGGGYRGPYLASSWIDAEGYLMLQLSSVDRPQNELDYDVWPHPDYF